MDECLVTGVDRVSESRELAEVVINACSDAKAQNISVLNVSGVSDIADYFVIVSARSDRQAQGITNRVLGELERLKLDGGSAEGMDSGQWIVLDLSTVVLHVFFEPVRRHYDIEGLWMSAPRVNYEVDEKSGAVHLLAA